MKTKQKKRNTKNFRKSKINKNRKLQNPNNWSNMSKTELKIIYGNRITSLNRKARTPFVSQIDSLPLIHLKDVIKYISSEKIVESGCHSNSTMLSSIYPKIKTVHGYVGTKMTDTEFNYFVDELPSNSKKLISFYFQNKGLLFIDFKRKMWYFNHSWNEVDGVHFDLTKSYNDKIIKRWWNYYPIETVDLSKNNVKQLNRIYQLTAIEKNSLITNGKYNLNNSQLKLVS